MDMKNPYRFTFRKDKGVYYVTFRHIPGRWFTTKSPDMTGAVKFAEDEMRRGGLLKNTRIPTLREFTQEIFTEKDPYGIRKRAALRNHKYSAAYWEQNQGRVKNHIEPAFGSHLIDAITDIAIEDWFLSLQSTKGKKYQQLSDDSKNKVLLCFRMIMHEAKRQGFIDSNPAEKVRMITARHKARKEITKGELALLFPANSEDLLKIWLSDVWAGYFLVLRDTGFRPGEVAALQKKNYFPQLSGVYTEQSVNFRTREVQQSIKTTESGQKYKAGILTAQTCKVLDELAEIMRDDDYFFKVNGKLLRPEVSNKHLKGAAKRAKISLAGRTQYSFRHAFETTLAGRVENKVLLELMAHTAFHPEYDHRDPEHVLTQLQPVREILENADSPT